MFFLEMTMGQYAGISATKIYARLVPGISSIGYAMIAIPIVVNFQYVVIMAYVGFKSLNHSSYFLFEAKLLPCNTL